MAIISPEVEPDFASPFPGAKSKFPKWGQSYLSLEILADIDESSQEEMGAKSKYLHPRLRLVENELRPPGPGMVLIRVLKATICGSDLHAVQSDSSGHSCFSGPAKNWEHGLTLGHEFVGETVASGEGVNFPLGIAVTGDSLVACFRDDCFECVSRLWNYCPRSYLIGFQSPGVFSEFAEIPAKCLYPIQKVIESRGYPDAIKVATLAEPLGVGINAFRHADRCVPHSRRSMLVHGGGMIGISTAISARRAGYYPVIISEPNFRRAATARDFADYVYHPDDLEGESGLLFDAFGKLGPTLVVEASGVVSVEAALRQTVPAGVVVTVSRTGQWFRAEGDYLVTNGKIVLGARGHVGCLPEAIDILADSSYPTERLITRELTGLKSLYTALQDPQSFPDDTKIICNIVP